MKKNAIVTIVLLWTVIQPIQAQNVNDALRYNDSSENFGYSSIFSSGQLTQPLGSLSALLNPAANALYSRSNLTFSIAGSQIGVKSNYIDKTSDDNLSAFKIGDVGFIYRFATSRGSFVMGFGYANTHSFTNTYSANVFNTNTTVSDYFATVQNSNLRLIGYNGFATDSLIHSNGLQSILRFNGYQGISQIIEQTEEGFQGSYYLTAATEFQKDLFVGLTLAFPVGEYRYNRTILERDDQNLYQISPFDVNTLTVSDEITSQQQGFYMILGLLFKPIEKLKMALSYRTGYDLYIDEEYLTSVITKYDDGFMPSDDFPYRLRGDFSYSITYPSRLMVGISSDILSRFSLSSSAELINYDQMKFNYPSESVGDELLLNTDLKQQLKSTWKFHLSGIFYFYNSQIHFGGTYEENPYKDQPFKLAYMGGLDYKISPEISFFINGRYRQTDTTYLLYEVNSPDIDTKLESLNTESWQFSYITGLRYRF